MLRRKLTVVVATAMMLTSMLAISGQASAQAGCQEFGNGVAFEVQNGTLREEIPTLAPVDEEVFFFKGLYCS